MSWKEFFKPTIAKTLILIILMGGISYYLTSTTHILDGMTLVGFPLGFWPVGSYYAGFANKVQILSALNFSWVNFISDLIFWYLVSCILVFLINKIKNRIKTQP